MSPHLPRPEMRRRAASLRPGNPYRKLASLNTWLVPWLVMLICCLPTIAQQPDFGMSPETDSVRQDFPLVDAAEIQSVMLDETSGDAVAGTAPSGIDLLALMLRGGAFMIPIGIMSLMVVALAFERLVSLRPQRILPRRLSRTLDELNDPPEEFDPSAALQACRQFPSPASRVITAMLLRTGQPLNEIERAATDTIQREAEKCVAPIRWLTLAAAATPLMGLLGTVWGMIVAFHESTTLTPDRSRSEQLSEGIYTALVTTLAGLVVAIPAAILALYLENRLARAFHRLEELVFDLSPGFTRFVGHHRLDRDGVLKTMDSTSEAFEAAKLPPPPPRVAQHHDSAKAV